MKKNVRFLAQGAVIAALYAALTCLASAFGLAYGNLQFRFSEALTVLAAFTPAAIPGLALGCFLGNLASPLGLLDLICGTAATLLASALTYLTRNVRLRGLPVLAPLFSAAVNALVVGAELAVFLPDGFTLKGYAVQALWVALGELAVCCGAGLPLAAAVGRLRRACSPKAQ